MVCPVSDVKSSLIFLQLLVFSGFSSPCDVTMSILFLGVVFFLHFLVVVGLSSWGNGVGAMFKLVFSSPPDFVYGVFPNFSQIKAVQANSQYF